MARRQSPETKLQFVNQSRDYYVRASERSSINFGSNFAHRFFKQPSLDLHNTVTNVNFIFIQYYEEKVRV